MSVTVLTLKMDEHKQCFWPFKLSHFNKGKGATVRQNKICGVYGNVAVSHGMCQKSHSRDTSCEVVPRVWQTSCSGESSMADVN